MHTLVPIAAVYVIAHYFSLLAYNGQAIAYLASDPLGKGWDLFGTADKAIDYGVIGATAIWYVQVGVLVVGPRLRPRSWPTTGRWRCTGRPAPPRPRNTGCSAVMVAFTTFGLFLLSQANQ